MNNLDKYIEEEAQEYGYAEPVRDFMLAGYAKLDWKEGFNTCMELEIPLKFAEWKTKEEFGYVGDFYRRKRIDPKMSGINWDQWRTRENELYQYWLNNIFLKSEK